MNLSRSSAIVGVFLASLALAQTPPGFTFELDILDPADYGFNDTTPVTLPDPPNGNEGTTLGEQRANVLRRAAEIWAEYLQSDVPIRIECHFENLGGTAEGYALAGASPVTVIQNFANAPLADTWYPVALANSLAGIDLSVGNNDISVTVNIAPDTDPLLPPWYYGLDGNAPDGTTELLDVLLHELGHGLGFVSFVNLQTGDFLQRDPDVFTRELYDVENVAFWTSMNKRDIQLSAVNDPDLVWSGDYTTVGIEAILEQSRGMLVDTPVGVAGEYEYEPATFGPAVPEGLSGELVVVDDGNDPAMDACDPLLNPELLVDKIAYIERGLCNFDSKVLKAQLAGAKAVIIGNNVIGEGPIPMGGNDTVDGIDLVIPAVCVSTADGVSLSSAGGVTLTMGVLTSFSIPAGSNDGKVRMHAPDPVELGSSVSHWSPDTFPDLLMEPFINPALREDLDLSLTLMKDIGWEITGIPFPYLTYPLWVQEHFAPDAVLTAETDDADDDGLLNIEEYYFGGDPLLPSADILPRLGGAEPDLEVLYTRATFFSDLVWAYETSTGMTGWSDAVEGVDYVEELVTPVEGSSAEEVRLRLLAPASGEKRFLRLRILPE